MATRLGNYSFDLGLMTPEQPPAKFFWTKQLDLRLVHAIQEDLGSEVDVRHQRKGGISVNWESVLQRLQNSPEAWPPVISSGEELKKRWDNNYRVWYAKKTLSETSEESGKLRASHIHLPTLFALLTQRDYFQESKPGPRKGTKMQKRKKRSLGDLNSSVFSLEDPASQEGDQEASVDVSELPDILPARSQEQQEEPQFDSRLETWLSFLRDSKYQEDFRIHTHSNLILEPRVLLESLIHAKTQEPFSHFLLLAKALSPPEWVSRILSLSDTSSIHLLIAQKESFFLLPSEEVMIDNQLLLFVMVHFPESSQEIPTIWSLFLGETRAQLNLAERIAKLIGVSVHEGFNWHFQGFSLDSSSDYLLQALDMFSTCLINFPFRGDAVTLNHVPEKRDLTRKKLLSLILLKPSASLRLAPPRRSEPLLLPFKSLHEAIKSLNLQLPPWCFELFERDYFLSAIHDVGKILIKVISLAENHTLQWHRKSEDEQLILIAEKDGALGNIFRIHKLSQRQVTLTLLGNLSSFKRLVICGVNYLLDKQEHVIQLSSKEGLSVEVTVNDVQVRVKC